MAAIASFSDDANRLADPESLYILGFKVIMKNKFSRQVAAISIIGGKLKI